MAEMFNNSEEAINFLINLNKTFFLNHKEHIKKYYKARKVHGSVLDSMIDYIDSGKLPIEEYTKITINDVVRETKILQFELKDGNKDDFAIFNELFIYKNHEKIPSLTEIYIEKKKFRNEEKVKMLYAMRDSFASLFKVIDLDNVNGYVTYQDVFTNKTYKIIDISMSSLSFGKNTSGLYVYNRIITYDGISFGTGIPCVFNSDNKKLKEFIKNHKYNKCSALSRCIILYEIYRKSKNVNVVHHHNYGRGR